MQAIESLWTGENIKLRLVFDLEADGLQLEEVNNIWCICTQNLDTKETLDFDDENIEAGVAYLSKASQLIGANIIWYDLPVLRKLYSLSYKGSVVDTTILSRLSNPDRPRPFGLPGEVGPHSVEAWGYRFGQGYEKIKNEDWSLFTPLMFERCKRDVATTTRIYEELYKELK